MCASETGSGPEKIISRTHLRLEFGDLTKSRAQAVGNAANPSLLGGGGVDGAIHREGGPAILKECRGIVAQIGRLETGRAVITTGGRLLAKYVIHTVGPVWRGGGQREAENLAMAYSESLALAGAEDRVGLGRAAVVVVAELGPTARSAAGNHPRLAAVVEVGD